MGCSGSKEGDKPGHHAPPTRGGAYTGTGAVQPTPAKRDVWPNGKDFPSVIQFMQIQKPDRPLEGVTLIDCLIDNARENGYVSLFPGALPPVTPFPFFLTAKTTMPRHPPFHTLPSHTAWWDATSASLTSTTATSATARSQTGPRFPVAL